MYHDNPDELADYRLNIYYSTKGPPVVDMSRTLCSHLNVLAMADFPLLLALETFYLKNQTSLPERVIVTTTMTDSVEESAAALLQTSYFTILHELKSFLKLYFNQLLNLVNIAKYLGS